MTGEPLELNAEELVRSGELAAALERRTGEPRVTTQTIKNWAERGLIPVEKTDADGTRWFRLNEALDAAMKNRPAGTNGGRRAGAGRPRKPRASKAGTTPVDLPIRAAADAAHARKGVQMRYQTSPDVRPIQALPASEVLNLTQAELRCLLGHVSADELGLTTVSLQRVKLVLDLQSQQREELERCGKLVEAEDVLARWTDVQTAIVRAIEAVPGRVADRVAQACWITPDAVDRLIGTLKDSGSPPAVLDLVRRSLMPPADLVPRVRALIADEVRAARQAIAEEQG